VTGASRGIGRACAVALGAAGYDVAFTARTVKEGDGRDDSDSGGNAVIEGSLERTAEQVTASGARALPLVADLTDFASLEAAVAAVATSWGRLDALVLNAVHTGAGSMLRIADTPIAALQTKLTANAVAQLVLVQAALPTMLAAGGGRIIAITSYAAAHEPSAPVGKGGWGYAYAASKAALGALTSSLSAEVRAAGIHVNLIVASTIDTPANRKAMGEAQAVNWVTPDDIADATMYLCSDHARAVHGATLEVFANA